MKNLVTGFLAGVAAMAAAMAIFFHVLDADVPADMPPTRVSADHPPTMASAGGTTAPDPNLPDPRLPAVEKADAKGNETRAPVSRTRPEDGATDSRAIPTVTSLEIPGGELTGDGEAGAKLLDAFRIDCEYGPGHGGRWPRGMLTPHTASWQGGPITFDTIDLGAGTARLRNAPGLTRNLEGELDVRVHATDTGLHFTVFAPGGELIVATVYAAHDSQRRQLGVVSFHGPRMDHESAQFYGACSVA